MGVTARSPQYSGLIGLQHGRHRGWRTFHGAGEYISVQSQADTRERRELADEPDTYVHRGLDESLAKEVAVQLTSRDPLSSHAREELGITETLMANPIQASLSSAAFAIGAAVPIIACAVTPIKSISLVTSIATVATLASLGYIAATSVVRLFGVVRCGSPSGAFSRWRSRLG
ncbi:MAG: VIT1/CCC1 transporter family protein [Fimbriimonadaceae bacterium]